ncbi:MAG: transposase, partial [Rickettsia endosymbiont of Graphium doson]|nr:transposase [Rickettsia endosymbiont of Graphium doson]
QGDIIEVEKLLKSKLNPKKRENIMKSIAHHWMQQGREEEKAIMAKKMKSIAHHWIQQGKEEAREEEKAIMAEKMQEEKVMMAKKMLKEGMSLDSVIKNTELSKADLEK